jgi:hypothetical protein
LCKQLCMYIRMKTSKKAKYPTMQIVEGVRDGKKVRQRTVAHLGVVKSKKDLERLKDLADKLIQRLEKEGLEIDPKVELKALRHKGTVYDGFSNVVARLMELTEFAKVILRWLAFFGQKLKLRNLTSIYNVKFNIYEGKVCPKGNDTLPNLRRKLL